ncbi:MAG: dTDP-4-dehydrorhamnose reductase [Kiritimatiellae bacterium]|nr:dTDP-4-dehydrorhamnose reductase [Kiritimatiellia bacterium]MDW8457540.1 dTDP-4-dehydrorhamnose reductase [Verrucomicrobiota bacterium]
MRLAIVGGRGMLGRDLAEAARRRGHEVEILSRPTFDITCPDRLAARLPEADVVVNCAAFTRVDDAEREREACRRVNAEGAGFLAHACAERGIYLIQISTDYVFDGEKGAPYREDDPPRPLNWYGETKLEGEQRVLESGARTTIVRTQSLFGVGGRNFVQAILRQIENGRKELSVVHDQVSCPTYTRHLAEALLDLAALQPPVRILHAAASGWCSWWEFAREITARTRPEVRVLQRRAAELALPARRPAFSVLDTSALQRLIGRGLPHWRDGLDAYLAEEPLAAAVRASASDQARSL